MGTIIARTRKDGTTAYAAQIAIKKDGRIVHREAEASDRKQAANAWIVKREGGTEKAWRKRPESGSDASRGDRSLYCAVRRLLALHRDGLRHLADRPERQRARTENGYTLRR